MVTVRKPSVVKVESLSAKKVTETYKEDLGISRIETDMKMYDELAPPPNCLFKDLWKVALDAGLSDSLKANITYDASGYEFSIDGTANWISFYKDCDIKYQIINGIFEK